MAPSLLNFKLKTQAKQQNPVSLRMPLMPSMCSSYSKTSQFWTFRKPIQARWAQLQCEFNRNESPMCFPHCLLRGYHPVLESLTLLIHWVQPIHP